MYKKLLLAALVSGAFGLTGCASDGDVAGAGSAAAAGAGAADVFGKAIFLRGELTEPQWAALPEMLIQPVSENVWKAKAELKVDWAPRGGNGECDETVCVIQRCYWMHLDSWYQLRLFFRISSRCL